VRISVLVVENVRNLRPQTLEPRERFNVFVGDNGQGKTNLLEAIYAVASLRSFRTSRLADMIAFGGSSQRARSQGEDDGSDEEARDEGSGPTDGRALDGSDEATRPMPSPSRAGGSGAGSGSGFDASGGPGLSGLGAASVAAGLDSSGGRDAADPHPGLAAAALAAGLAGRDAKRAFGGLGDATGTFDGDEVSAERALGDVAAAMSTFGPEAAAVAKRVLGDAAAALTAVPAPLREARIRARVLKDDLTRVYEVIVGEHGRKVTLDGKAARPLARYFGGFNVVVFTPEDLQLPRGAPGERRRFLDRAVFNARPEYLASVQDYEKVLKQRNAILKMNAQGSMAPARVEEMLQIYDEQLAHLGLAVANARASLVEDLQPEVSAAFSAITHSERRASAQYVSKTAGQSVDAIIGHHKAGRMKDLATSSTQFGPHRDDLAFTLDGHDAGSFASQGQLRAIMLAWKTAELDVLSRVHGDQPILLLDDVSSELDPARNAYLFEHLANQAGQCFITTTHENHVLLTRDRANYRIENGLIST
jgi:DNA replication and repair protein RecF